MDCAVLVKLLSQETKEALEAATALTRRLQSTEASLAAAQVCKRLFLLSGIDFRIASAVVWKLRSVVWWVLFSPPEHGTGHSEAAEIRD